MNALASIVITLDGIVIEVKLVAPWNVLEGMLVTPCGIIIEIKLDANINTPIPKFNTLDVIVI